MPILAGLAVAVLACSSAAAPAPAGPKAAAASDVVVTGPDWAQGVRVSLHDTLAVPPPANYEEWRVHAADDAVVRLLTPEDHVRRPGAEGWRFEAVGRGQTVVTFIPIVPAGDRGDRPNEPHFTLKVTVQ